MANVSNLSRCPVCYGTEKNDKRAGWGRELLDRIRRCEYPQYMLTSAPPIAKGELSVVRFDHIQPVGKHHDSFEPLGYRLGDEALKLMDDWIEWLRCGHLDRRTFLGELQESFKSE